MGCYRQRHQRAVAVEAWGKRGQSTVEYAVVLFGFLALVLALGALWRFLQDGALVQHALQSASHHVTMVSKGALLDVFLH